MMTGREGGAGRLCIGWHEYSCGRNRLDRDKSRVDDGAVTVANRSTHVAMEEMAVGADEPLDRRTSLTGCGLPDWQGRNILSAHSSPDLIC